MSIRAVALLAILAALLAGCGKKGPAAPAKDPALQNLPFEPLTAKPAQAVQPPAAPEPRPTQEPAANTPRVLKWDALMPADYQADKLYGKANDLFGKADIGKLSDSDPRARKLMKDLRKLWLEAPVVPELDGQLVKLPGFAIPLEGGNRHLLRFVLVPYYGACIHSPPPPLNQTVVVESPQGASIRQAFDMVWVTGRMHVRRESTDLADAGYVIEATKVEPYTD